MMPAVIARAKIDNFLLGLPHHPSFYPLDDKQKRRRKSYKGGLLDSSFYGIITACSSSSIVLGIHLGRDGYNHREKRDRLKEENINWNVQFVPNFREAKASLVYSDFIFRMFILRRMLLLVAWKSPFPKESPQQ